MFQVVVSVKDLAAQAFGRPVFVPTAGVAIRSFRDEVNREASDNDIFRHPADYELYQIGTFDDSTGLVEALQPPKLLSRALDLSERGGS